MSVLASELLASQDNLIREAALALPHSFSSCTYALGALRQAVYLCITCASPRGICASCSVACHTDHEQIELFPKRSFRCDCPTAALAHPCTLHKKPEPENTDNKYGRNFEGVFCRCERPYDPQTEAETMIQCLACEDWFHESCLNLRERPPPPGSPKPEEEPADDDAASEASTSDLPPPLLSADDYNAFVCGACVCKIDTLKRYAGTEGAVMVSRVDTSSLWTVLGASSKTDDSVEVAEVGTKRSRSPSPSASGQHEHKKRRVSPSASTSETRCLAPPINPAARTILDANGTSDLGAGDVFLSEGWRERWCRCANCLPSLSSHPYLLEEEETYEPPEDPDSGLSLEELGMRALQRLPRERALDGIRAFNAMRDDLVKYLRPFATEGKVVDEDAVKTFFESRLEAA
ncbi:hypothetical protein PLICRDRAFT_68097, partial [Plicaturopsis crispa FD-325 SS-3]